MDLVALAYVSTATGPLSTADLEALLVDARSVNQHEQVTGALLHHDGSFFQYLEGPPEGVKRVYERILSSRKHTGLIELIHAPIQERHFAQWHMGVAEAPGTLLQKLANSQWASTLVSLRVSRLPPAGVALLLDFWSRAGRSHF